MSFIRSFRAVMKLSHLQHARREALVDAQQKLHDFECLREFYAHNATMLRERITRLHAEIDADERRTRAATLTNEQDDRSFQTVDHDWRGAVQESTTGPAA